MTMLKFQNRDVLEFDFKKNKFEILSSECLPFFLRNALVDTRFIRRDSFEEMLNLVVRDRERLFRYFRTRTLNFGRTNAKQILNALGVDQTVDDGNIMRLMFLCKGLSVPDDYWITNHPEEKWEDVNLRDNPLHETLFHVALFGTTVATITGDIRTPELTNQGSFAKAWRRENGKLFLMKASGNARESEREVSVSRILDHTNVPHVPYWGETVEGKFVSVCESLANADRSIVPAYEFMHWCHDRGTGWLEEAKGLDLENFGKMLVVDYLVSNSDRHSGNWGFFMDSATGGLTGMHPLFDHNLAFDAGTMAHPNGYDSRILENTSKLDAARDAVRYADLRIRPSIPRECFLEQHHMDSFLSRCKRLGFHVTPSFTNGPAVPSGRNWR